MASQRRAMAGSRYNALFQQTMLRIRDPSITVPFYEKNFGMRLVHRYDFPQWKFSLYFLERTHDGVELPAPGTKASEKYLWAMKGTTLELTHNHGSEEDPEFSVWSGNSGNDLPQDSPLYREAVTRGFGHIAFNVEDVYDATARLEKEGVKFQKKPDEGRMKGLAFALDPDGYWIELVGRPKGLFSEYQNLSQTMMRVKDAQATIAFYRDIMGMTLVRAMHIPGDFSNYFLACLTPGEKEKAPDPEGPDAKEFVKTLWQPVLELTHNHGTESKEDFQVHTGNSDSKGFGHIGFLVDDLTKCCQEMLEAGAPFFKKPEDGNMHQIAFALDPSGYRVEIIQRGTTFEGVCSNF
jgi:lactoylglutathione lyase